MYYILENVESEIVKPQTPAHIFTINIIMVFKREDKNALKLIFIPDGHNHATFLAIVWRCLLQRWFLIFQTNLQPWYFLLVSNPTSNQDQTSRQIWPCAATKFPKFFVFKTFLQQLWIECTIVEQSLNSPCINMLAVIKIICHYVMQIITGFQLPSLVIAMLLSQPSVFKGQYERSHESLSEAHYNA